MRSRAGVGQGAGALELAHRRRGGGRSGGPKLRLSSILSNVRQQEPDSQFFYFIRAIVLT
jgi:hypothetical protein